MYNRPGTALKNIAIVTCILGILGSIYLAFLLSNSVNSILTFIVVLILGIVFSWVQGLLVYGFGVIVDYADIKKNNNDNPPLDTKKREDNFTPGTALPNKQSIPKGQMPASSTEEIQKTTQPQATAFRKPQPAHPVNPDIEIDEEAPLEIQALQKAYRDGFISEETYLKEKKQLLSKQ